jgi:hypothetical protein
LKPTIINHVLKTAYLGENVIDWLKQKVAQNFAIILGYLIFSKNHNKPPKVAQIGKILPNLVTLNGTLTKTQNGSYKTFFEQICSFFCIN